MNFSSNEWLPLIVTTSFAAGLNVYATVATLGILGRVGVLPLPPSLHLLAAWYVIALALVLFGIEFFADKIPAFDLVWNALHTFIRIPIAALLAYRATATLPPRGTSNRCCSRRRHCLCCPRGKNQCSRCRYLVTRTTFECRVECWRRSRRNLPDLVCHPTSLLGRWHYGSPADRYCHSDPLDDSFPARFIPRRKTSPRTGNREPRTENGRVVDSASLARAARIYSWRRRPHLPTFPPRSKKSARAAWWSWSMTKTARTRAISPSPPKKSLP